MVEELECKLRFVVTDKSSGDEIVLVESEEEDSGVDLEDVREREVALEE